MASSYIEKPVVRSNVVDVTSASRTDLIDGGEMERGVSRLGRELRPKIKNPSRFHIARVCYLVNFLLCESSFHRPLSYLWVSHVAW